jgi:hypothetical protein
MQDPELRSRVPVVRTADVQPTKMTWVNYLLAIAPLLLVLSLWLCNGCAMAVVFLLLYGWWGAALLAHFGNPFFPSLNQIFRSDYAAPSSFSASPAFALPSLRDKLLFPFTRISIFGSLNWAGLFDLRMAFALPLAATWTFRNHIPL